MSSSQTLPVAGRSKDASSWLAKPLAPEEVRTGDFLALLHITYEMPSFLWCSDAALVPQDQPVRMQFLPEDGGLPLKVRAVCLPFVLVKNAAGEHRTLDLRRYRVARLHPTYAKIAWKAGKKAQNKPATL